jgi:hypothetical protein
MNSNHRYSARQDDGCPFHISARLTWLFQIVLQSRDRCQPLVRCRRRSNSRLPASPFLASRMIPVLRAVDALVRRLGSLPITTAKVSASDSPSRIAMKAEHSEPCHIPLNVLKIQRSIYCSARQLRCGFFCEAMIQAVNAFACQGRPEAGHPPRSFVQGIFVFSSFRSKIGLTQVVISETL